jgi:outer membrane protein OmpA-like peptidoglycan-associated protein
MLMKALEALKANPKLTLEIESHTDAIASNDFNQFLSQKRAATVVDFLSQRGISPKRLVAKGMGETMIANHCIDGIDCSDGEHKYNRRTVFKLIYN